MKVLVGCEKSGLVALSFEARGHSAWSCDILPAENSQHHIQDDVLDYLCTGWDMGIFFPPCTDLCVSGARYFSEKIKDGRQQRSINFFMALANAPIPKICIENPVGIMSTVFRKPDQIIQPYYFGHDASKKTCLWLKNLPRLNPTCIIDKERYANQTPSGQNNLGLGKQRAEERSRTYLGIALAMAEQWG